MPPKKNTKVAKPTKKSTTTIPKKASLKKKDDIEEDIDENSVSEEIEESEELEEDLDKSDSIDYSDDEDEEDDEEDNEESDKSDDENYETLEYIIDVREADKSERIILTGLQRQMTDRVTHAELANIVSVRAAQIEKDPVCFVEVDPIDTPQAIAIKELKKRVCPFKIIRHSHSNVYEEWKVNEMKIPWNSTGMMNVL